MKIRKERIPCAACQTEVDREDRGFGVPLEADGTLHHFKRCRDALKVQRDEAREQQKSLSSHFEILLGAVHKKWCDGIDCEICAHLRSKEGVAVSP